MPHAIRLTRAWALSLRRVRAGARDDHRESGSAGAVGLSPGGVLAAAVLRLVLGGLAVRRRRRGA